MSNDVSEVRPARTAIVLFFLIAVLIAWDLIGDYLKGAGILHLSIELMGLHRLRHTR